MDNSVYTNQQPVTVRNNLEEPMSFGEWMVTLLILFIPVANLVMLFVWAFSDDTKKSKSNFCKAYLVWCLIWTAISIVLLIIIVAISISFATKSYYY